MDAEVHGDEVEDITADGAPEAAEHVVWATGLGVDGEHGPLFSDVDLALTPGFHAIQMPGGPAQDVLLLTVAGRFAPTRGTVVLTADGSFGYTPTAAARAAGAGTDSFTVTVDDGHGATQTVTVSVGIAASTPGNTLPVTAAVAYTSSVNTVTGVVTGQIAVTDSSPLRSESVV